MGLPKDLLDQARHLTIREPKRPKQASLRRAVSTAYYALFHLLVDDATRFLVGGAAPSRDVLRRVLRRAFAHGSMKSVAKALKGGTPPRQWRAAIRAPIPRDLRLVADAFVELQEARHEADYDTSKVYRRQEASELVKRCEQAFTAWSRCRRTAEGEAFMVALLAHEHPRG